MLPRRTGADLRHRKRSSLVEIAFADLTRPDLSGEAIRLGRLLTELLPEPEVMGLLALMLLQEPRRGARTSPAGDLIVLEDQDRSLWNRDQIAEGKVLVERALSSRRFSPYALQAAIAAPARRRAQRSGYGLGANCTTCWRKRNPRPWSS